MTASQYKRWLGGLALLLLAAGSSGSGDAAESKSPLPRWRDTSGMVFVRGAQFVFGGRDVRVRSFYMDQYEVTNGEYCRFLNADTAHAKHWNDKQEIEKHDGKFVAKAGKRRWPICFVSWHDAEAYAGWTGKRLPTESEWEWAAAGPEGSKYPWGNAPLTPARANFGKNVGHPQPVGSYADGKNPLDIYDLTGNVAEGVSMTWIAPRSQPRIRIGRRHTPGAEAVGSWQRSIKAPEPAARTSPKRACRASASAACVQPAACSFCWARILRSWNSPPVQLT
ncbi:MAG: SUMF1/EgtB/PvdO family nonheme iron enzyme [Pirellulaceae bacterium]|nr:SUMF1/EgtB/PvdO family nonheme iron enzyme [Pirellulaceae bacterium]